MKSLFNKSGPIRAMVDLFLEQTKEFGKKTQGFSQKTQGFEKNSKLWRQLALGCLLKVGQKISLS